ncbi:hypothetical protein BD410DRAFT_712419 [Rickenella mellea]|uniref:Uncharacterized protein n=1 Tax=Rickenella mellea TaxID=50990 RepID=A0A4Y7QNA0_9AGAM|nr:hypothetical protein BD410DRAFT_712419 [Rickenella mellea]
MLELLLRLRRRELPWEVVDYKVVEPVPMFYDDEDIDIVLVSECETRGTYVFDINELGKWHAARSLEFSRQQLLRELSNKGYNSLISEGWSMTVLRKGKRHRMVVQYDGRGAIISGKFDPRPPPFLDMLNSS